MGQHAWVLEVRPGYEEEYKKRHDEIWPELVDAIKDAGLENYTLFRRGTTITGYVECSPDVATAFAKLAPTDVNARWAKWFEEIIVSLVDEDGNLYRAEEVWHLA